MGYVGTPVVLHVHRLARTASGVVGHIRQTAANQLVLVLWVSGYVIGKEVFISVLRGHGCRRSCWDYLRVGLVRHPQYRHD
jgi:hypothetical protein